MKWCLPHITDKYSAIVSCHGYFEIQRADTYNSYASGMGPVYHRNDDGSRSRLPDPVVVAEGPVADLGLTYDPYFDDLVEEDQEVIEAAVRRYISKRGL